jgi:WD40 repeat protein
MTKRTVAKMIFGLLIAAALVSGTAQGARAMSNMSIQTGAPFTGHTEPVASLAFSPDGATLASGSCAQAEMKPDGTQLGFKSVCQLGEIRLWNAATGQQVGQPLTGHAGTVSAVAFNPDGKTLASGALDGSIMLWDAATGKAIGQPLAGQGKPITGLAFSSDGTILAAASDHIQMWDAATGQPVGQPLAGQGEPITGLAFSSDGKILGAASDHIQTWDTATRTSVSQPLANLPANVDGVAFSRDGKTLAFVSNSQLGVVDLASGQQTIHPLNFPASNRRADVHTVQSLALSPDGRTAATGGCGEVRSLPQGQRACARGEIWLWDVVTGQPTSPGGGSR